MFRDLESIVNSWIGTPYQHGANKKHLAVDCIHFIANVYLELGIIKFVKEIDSYPLDWYRARNNGTIELIEWHIDNAWCGNGKCIHLNEPQKLSFSIGDIVGFKINSYVVNHTGIVLKQNRLAHASTRAKKVVVESMVAYQNYLTDCFHFER